MTDNSSNPMTPATLREIADCSPKRCFDALMWAAGEIERLRDRCQLFEGRTVETSGELRDWYCHDGIKVHLLTGMDRETALTSLREEMPNAEERDLKPSGGRAHIIFNSSPAEASAPRKLTASESGSFDKAFARSPRRVNDGSIVAELRKLHADILECDEGRESPMMALVRRAADALEGADETSVRTPKEGDEVVLHFQLGERAGGIRPSQDGWRISEVRRSTYYFLKHPDGSVISLMPGQFSVKHPVNPL